jgi:hypothetical protein
MDDSNGRRQTAKGDDNGRRQTAKDNGRQKATAMDGNDDMKREV